MLTAIMHLVMYFEQQWRAKALAYINCTCRSFVNRKLSPCFRFTGRRC